MKTQKHVLQASYRQCWQRIPPQIIMMRVSKEQIRCNICEDPGVFAP